MAAAQETSNESEIVRDFLDLDPFLLPLIRDLKYSIPANPSCPPEVLAELATDEDTWMCRAVAGNPSCPPEALKQMAEDALCAWSHGMETLEGDSWKKLKLCAGNPSCPPDLLAELATYTHETRAENPSWQPETLEELVE